MTDLTINIPGFDIACRTWGKKESPILIALHGWLDNANSFAPLAPFLSEHFYIIALDLPGHGLSSHLPVGCHYHFMDAIFTIFKAIDALGYQRVHLLGHSMGACISSLMAGIAPERIEKLVLIEGLGPFSAPSQTCQEQLSRYLNRYETYDAQPFRPYKTIDAAAEARVKKGHVSVEIARILCERGVIMQDGLFYWCHDRRLVIPSPLYMTEGQVLSCLSNIASPNLLIWADQGFHFEPTIMANRICSVSNLTEEKLSGGHHIHMEKPEEVASVILNFI